MRAILIVLCVQSTSCWRETAKCKDKKPDLASIYKQFDRRNATNITNATSVEETSAKAVSIKQHGVGTSARMQAAEAPGPGSFLETSEVQDSEGRRRHAVVADWSQSEDERIAANESSLLSGSSHDRRRHAVIADFNQAGLESQSIDVPASFMETSETEVQVSEGRRRHAVVADWAQSEAAEAADGATAVAEEGTAANETFSSSGLGSEAESSHDRRRHAVIADFSPNQAGVESQSIDAPSSFIETSETEVQVSGGRRRHAVVADWAAEEGTAANETSSLGSEAESSHDRRRHSVIADFSKHEANSQSEMPPASFIETSAEVSAVVKESPPNRLYSSFQGFSPVKSGPDRIHSSLVQTSEEKSSILRSENITADN
jgi:hypothetical protein